jgi:putative component of membrane protein insertase Oxa1/YidC/SpoIIIJ protein YidD
MAFCLVLPAFSAVFGSQEKMKGPGGKRQQHAARQEPETSAPRLVLLGALTLFQRYISPIDGERCGFSPSCSAFARQAVGGRGAVQGVIVTADRLMRCTLFKRPGPDYLLLPDGKLFDPVDYNLLSSP